MVTGASMKTAWAILLLTGVAAGQMSKEDKPKTAIEGWITYCNIYGTEVEFQGLDGHHYPIQLMFPVRRCENYRRGHHYRWVVSRFSDSANMFYMLQVDEVLDSRVVQPSESWDGGR